MQAQRKFEQPASPAAPVGAAEDTFDWTPRLAEGLRGQASPTHLLWDELAQRLQDTPRAAPMTVERKWPVPMRLAIVLGLSMVAWAGVYAAVVAVI